MTRKYLRYFTAQFSKLSSLLGIRLLVIFAPNVLPEVLEVVRTLFLHHSIVPDKKMVEKISTKNIAAPVIAEGFVVAIADATVTSRSLGLLDCPHHP